MAKRIQFNRFAGRPLPPGARWVGRGSKVGNPYVVGDPGVPDNATAAALYEADLVTGRLVTRIKDRTYHITLEYIRQHYRGIDVACSCALDEPCHADVIRANC